MYYLTALRTHLETKFTAQYALKNIAKKVTFKPNKRKGDAVRFKLLNKSDRLFSMYQIVFITERAFLWKRP